LLSLSVFAQDREEGDKQDANDQPGFNAEAVVSSPSIPYQVRLDAVRQRLAEAESKQTSDRRELADALLSLVRLSNEGHLLDNDTLALAVRSEQANSAAYGANSSEHLRALTALSVADYLRGKFSDSRSYGEQAIETAERLGLSGRDLADALDAVGTACIDQGDYPSAARAFDRAVLLLRGNLDENPLLAEILAGRAHERFLSGDIPGARADLEEALKISLSKANPDDLRRAQALNNLGVFLESTGHSKQAIPLLERSLAIRIKSFAPENALVLSTTTNLANAYSGSSQFRKAWPLFERALPAYDKVFGHIHPSTAYATGTYSAALAAGGELALATKTALEAERLSRGHFILAAETLPESQALAYAESRGHGLHIALSIAAKLPAAALDEIYEEAIRSRALVADEMAARQRDIGLIRDTGISRLAQQLADSRRALMSLLQQPPGTPGLADRIARAEREIENVESDLDRLSASFRQRRQADRVTLAQIRGAIPEGAVLISYVRYLRYPVRPENPDAARAYAYAAFVAEATGPIRFFPLGDAKSIDNLVSAVRASVRNEAASGGLSSLRNERQYREAALQLRKRIWNPLQSAVGRAPQIFIVPDGVLDLVPFGALPQGAFGYLLEGAGKIHYLSSERDLLPVAGKTESAGILAIGSPEFTSQAEIRESAALRGAEGGCSAWNAMRFPPLPASLDEIGDLTEIWKRSGADGPLLDLSGPAATRASFLRDATGKRLLHIATHAYFIPPECAGGNPLLRAGLAFSGANLSQDGERKGIVTAQEIAALDLSGVRWAVLSACDTGNGEVRNGEGVLGLQRSFRLAGAETVVMSLWPADDEETRAFMRRFYTALLGDRESTASAMQTATLERLRDLRAAGKSTHPFHWAGFIASGNWR